MYTSVPKTKTNHSGYILNPNIKMFDLVYTDKYIEYVNNHYVYGGEPVTSTYCSAHILDLIVEKIEDIEADDMEKLDRLLAIITNPIITRKSHRRIGISNNGGKL